MGNYQKFLHIRKDYTYFTICVKKLENTNILKNRAVFYACSLENTYSSYFLIKKKLKNKKRGGAKEKNKYIKDEGRGKLIGTIRNFSIFFISFS
ncbi:hypothetical protein PFTANZ_01394 [Plasmodium falciparum Tanzania (2000708)]|uniref:Uncharacterized protein n=1 Tax=Plasmodium falciparum Tanzania (2000708) TaxID=1036725 RepID=A0A024WAN4_PLAFA|nr:hypothetical protein PFTANZ_01394 [Plasmodium falciparum Tanzania (2000708)]